ncbi:MAG: C40 family peptidase [Actinobacteria bacterium]|nr:C40 family peptidase [Actinomycetota bacterium]
MPNTKRIAAAALQPADVIFFGARGPRSKPAEVDHMGIYAGNGWFVHSSRYGVALELLSGWYEERLRLGPQAARRGKACASYGSKRVGAFP